MITNDLHLITKAIDDSLAFVQNDLGGLVNVIVNVPDYMADNTKSTNTKDWCFWKPICSDVTDADISNYELQTGIRLPESYKAFLRYKYFVDLNFGHEVIFFRHTRSWISDNMDKISMWGKEFTLAKGLLPFADYSDWGLVCFDANRSYEDNEYNMVVIDHEDIDNPNEYIHGRFTFVDLVKEMYNRFTEWKAEVLKED